MITIFLATFLFCYLLLWYVKTVNIDRKLSSLPTAPALPLIGSALLFLGDGEKIANSLIMIGDLAFKHKGAVKIWVGSKLYVAIANPEDAQVVLESCLDKGDVYRFMKPWLGNGLFLAPVNIWRNHRKVLLPVFNNKIIDQYIEIVSEQSEILVNRLEEHNDQKSFDAFRYITSCTLDIVYESSMGKRMDFQRTSEPSYIRARQIIMNIMNMRLFKLWLQPDCLFNLTPYAKTQESNIKITRQFTDEVVQMRRHEYEHNKLNTADYKKNKSPNKIQSVLDLLFGREINFTNVELREHIDSITVAGNDATALTISFALVLLGVYQDVQEKVYQEQQSIFGSNKNARATKEDLQRMTYLDRVIKETMRLYPVVPIVARRIDKNLHLPHSGVTLPAGCEAVIGSFAIHKYKEVWGPDAEDFDPDRFLPDRFSTIHSAAFMPFSFGSRNCIGRNLGLLLIKGILSRMCRTYKINSNGVGPIKMEMLLFPVNGHLIQITRR